jgi:hypothetical protein
MRASAVEWFVRDRRGEAQKQARYFHERGFSFIDLREAHLDFMRVIYGTEVPRLADCVGRTMVDEDFMPLGCVVVWIEPDQAYRLWSDAGDIATYAQLGVWDAGGIGTYRRPGKNWLYADFGRWLRIFPKDILRAIKPVCDHLRKHQVYILHASADESTPGSDTLLNWLGAVPTGEHDGIGPLYRLDLRECKL